MKPQFLRLFLSAVVFAAVVLSLAACSPSAFTSTGNQTDAADLDGESVETSGEFEAATTADGDTGIAENEETASETEAPADLDAEEPAETEAETEAETPVEVENEAVEGEAEQLGLDSLEPGFGLFSSTTPVVLLGTGFGPDLVVKVGEVQVAVEVVSTSRARADFPPVAFNTPGVNQDKNLVFNGYLFIMTITGYPRGGVNNGLAMLGKSVEKA